MWQLGDRLAPYHIDLTQMSCPTLARRSTEFMARDYVVGSDPSDPLLSRLPRGTRKVWRSGSYGYACMHRPYGAGVRAGDYGGDFMIWWDAAVMLGLIGKPGSPSGANPQDYLPCSARLTAFDAPGSKPLAMCRSLGVHEGWDPDYARVHAIPTQLAPLFGLTAKDVTPVIAVATPFVFVDGRAKYIRMSFYDMLGLMLSRNKGALQPAGGS